MDFDFISSHLLSQHLGKRADANETAAFARQLEFIYTQTYDVLYPDLKARTLIPVDNSVPNSVKVYTYRQFDKSGKAKVIQDFSQDFPTANIKGNEFIQGIQSLGASYEYSIQNLREAAYGNIQLDMQDADAARRMIESAIDEIACVGDADSGLVGLANAPNIQQFTLNTLGTGGSTSWALKSSDAIVADLNAMASQVVTSTLRVHTPDTLLLDIASQELLSSRRADNYNQNSILEYFLAQNPHIKNVDWWPRLSTAGSSGGPRILMYTRNPRNQVLVIPQEFEQMAPEQHKMMFSVACHARVGGVNVRYPKSIIFADGNAG